VSDGVLSRQEHCEICRIREALERLADAAEDDDD